MNEQLKLIAELLTKLSAKDAAGVVLEAARLLGVYEQRLNAAMAREQQLRTDLADANKACDELVAERDAARAECERLHAHPDVRAAHAAKMKAEAARLLAQAAALDPTHTAE